MTFEVKREGEVVSRFICKHIFPEDLQNVCLVCTLRIDTGSPDVLVLAADIWLLKTFRLQLKSSV